MISRIGLGLWLVAGVLLAGCGAEADRPRAVPASPGSAASGPNAQAPETSPRNIPMH